MCSCALCIGRLLLYGENVWRFINHEEYVEVVWLALENNGITKHKHAVVYRPTRTFKHSNVAACEMQFNKITKLLSDEQYERELNNRLCMCVCVWLWTL